MPQFDTERFCSIVDKERITYCHVVPRVLTALAHEPAVDMYSLNSLKMLGSAAAPLSTGLIHDVYRRLKIPIVQAYGMSEMSPATHQLVSITSKLDFPSTS